ncbi:MAG: hypothetical protein WCY68_00720 [Desulfuromonadales bacterium]
MKTNIQAWEEKCGRCGRCCFEKIEFEGEIYYTDTPCEWLDLETRLCAVYANRQKVRPGCVKLTRRVIARGLLPADCPYVAGISDYPAPHLWPDITLMEKEEQGRSAK